MSKPRIHWVDTAKGIAILMVILGHTQCAPVYLRAVAVSCQVPLLFFLSGYTFRPKSIRLLIGSSARQLLVPWVLVSLYSLCINNQRLTLPALASGLYFNLSWQVNPSVPAVGPSWFLLALFFARIILNGLVEPSQRRNYPAMLWLSSLCFGTIAVVLANLLDRLVPLGISQIFSAIAYLILGYMFRQSNSLDSRVRHIGIAMIPLCLIWGLCILVSTIDIGSNLYLGFPAISQIGSLAGIAVVIRLSVLIDGFSRAPSDLLAWIGMNSLGIYIVHSLDMSIPWNDLVLHAWSMYSPVGLLVFFARASFDTLVYKSIAAK